MTDGIGENLLVGTEPVEPTPPAEPVQETPVTETPVETPPVEPEKPQLVKVKINGEEIEKPLDEVIKDYSLSQASYKRFEEAAAEKRKLQEERIQWEQDKQRQQQVSQIEQWKAQAERDSSEFKQRFEQQFGTEFLPIIPGNEWQQAIFNDYMMNLSHQRQQMQQAQMSLQQIQVWKDANPDDARRIEDAAWGSKDRKIITALDAVEAGTATQEQVDSIRKFGEKVLSAPKAQPLPQAINKPQAPSLPQPSAPQENMRGDDEIDWDRFAKEPAYQSKMFGAYLRQQKR